MKTKMKRIRKGKTRKMYGGSPYTDILNQYFLTPTLDHISQKSVLQGSFFGGDVVCNITMLADYHNPITRNGIDMVTAFGDFATMYQRHKASLPQLDVFIESTENSVKHVYPTMQMNAHNQQIINVSIAMNRCYLRGACPFNLHWIDTHDVPVSRTTWNPPCVGTPTLAQASLPKWIYDLGTMHLSSNDIQFALWRSNYGIHSKIRTTPIPGGIQFTDIQDCMKILTENCIIKREIAKATRVNPQFTYGYAKAILRQLILRPSFSNSIALPGLVCRHVLEIYTVARIINKRMTHVLIYVGGAHSTFLSQIVRTMGLRTLIHLDEMATAAMPVDATQGPYDFFSTYDNIPYDIPLPQLVPESEDDTVVYPARPLNVPFPYGQIPPPLPPLHTFPPLPTFQPPPLINSYADMRMQISPSQLPPPPPQLTYVPPPQLTYVPPPQLTYVPPPQLTYEPPPQLTYVPPPTGYTHNRAHTLLNWLTDPNRI